MQSFKNLNEIIQELKGDCICKKYLLMEQIMSKFLQSLETNIRFAGKNDKTYSCDVFQTTFIYSGFVSEKGVQKAADIADQLKAPGLSQQQKIELFHKSIRVWEDEESFSIYDHFMVLCFSLGMPLYISHGFEKEKCFFNISKINDLRYDKFRIEIEASDLESFFKSKKLPLPFQLYVDAPLNTQTVYRKLDTSGWKTEYNLDDIMIIPTNHNDAKIGNKIIISFSDKTDRNCFFKIGTQWHIKFGDNIFLDADRLGWRYLHYLIRNNGEPIPASFLVAKQDLLMSFGEYLEDDNEKVTTDQEGNSISNLEDLFRRVELGDPKSKEIIEKYIQELQFRFNLETNTETKYDLKNTIEEIEKKMQEYRFNSKNQKSFEDEQSAARKSVAKAINGAISAITLPEYSEIRDHFSSRRNVTFGKFFIYTSKDVKWTLWPPKN